MVNTANIIANRVLHILGKQSLQPKFTGLVREVRTESHSLIAGEERGIAVRTNAEVEMEDLDFSNFGLTIRALTHKNEYSKRFPRGGSSHRSGDIIFSPFFYISRLG